MDCLGLVNGFLSNRLVVPCLIALSPIHAVIYEGFEALQSCCVSYLFIPSANHISWHGEGTEEMSGEQIDTDFVCP